MQSWALPTDISCFHRWASKAAVSDTVEPVEKLFGSSVSGGFKLEGLESGACDGAKEGADSSLALPQGQCVLGRDSLGPGSDQLPQGLRKSCPQAK